MLTQNIKVTVGILQGTQKGFFLNGRPSARFTLLAGETYIFDQSDASNAMHPLRLSLKEGGIQAGGSEFKTGVTVSNSIPDQTLFSDTIGCACKTASSNI